MAHAWQAHGTNVQIDARLLVIAALVAFRCCPAASCQTPRQTGSSVVTLTEQTFEHRTQAATGQTTGPWFVMFSAPDGLPQCPSCEHANTQWDQTAGEQASSHSFTQYAQVMATAPGSVKLFQRFGVEELPAYVLFRDGKMFRYVGDGTDLLAFALHEFREVHGESVPAPPSFWSQLVETYQDAKDEYWTADNKRSLFAVGVVALPVLPWALPLMVWLRQRRLKKVD